MTLAAFCVSDKGRMTTPTLLLIASFRLAADLWPLAQDEDALRMVSATLMATLAWHWFPLSEAFNLYSIDRSHHLSFDDSKYERDIDLVFLSNVFLGLLSVLGMLWKVFPEIFRNELAFELPQQS